MGTAAGVSGAVLWLRADDLAGADGSSQSSWLDQSGEGNDATASAFGTAATTNPTLEWGETPNAGVAVKFGSYGRSAKNTYKAFVLPDLGLGSSGEIWAAIRSPYSGGDNTLSPSHWHFGTAAADNTLFPYTNGNIYENFGVTARSNFAPVSDLVSKFRLYRVQIDSGTHKAWVDGTQRLTATGKTAGWHATPAIGRSLLGGGSGSFDAQFGGWIAELMVFDHALSSTDATTVSDYLTARHFHFTGYAGEVQTDTPVGYYRAAEPSGTDMFDASGAHRNAAYNASGVTYGVTGPIDDAVTFNGSTGQASIAWASLNLDTALTASHTVEFWVKTTATGTAVGDPAFVSASESNTARRFVIGLSDGAGTITVQHGGTYAETRGTTPVNDGEWHHVVVWICGTGGPHPKIYVDGVEESYAATGYDTSYTNLSNPTVRIAKNGRGAYLAASMSEVAFYNGELSAARVAAHYAAASPPTGATGSIAGTLPVLTGALSGTVTDRGSIAGTLPAVTGSLSGTVTTTGALAGTLPALTGSLGGSSGVTTGTLAGTLPAVIGGLSGVVTATGTLAGDLPTLTGSLEGEVGPTAPGATGDVAGVLPALTGELVALGVGEDAQLAIADVVVEALAFVELVPAADIDVAVPILSEKHPSPVLSAALPATQAWVDYTPTTTVVGYAHIWIDGQDITYFRDAPTIVRNWQKEAPFGDKACMWEMPQLDPWDVIGEGDLSFLRPKAPVVIGIVDLDGNVEVKWSGFYHARTRGFDTGGEDYVFEAHGDLWAGLYQYAPVVPYQAPVDIGVLIPRLLNGIINAPFDPIPETVTGLMTRYRPARKEYVWQSVQNILAKDGWTDDGRQWTLVRRGASSFGLALKAATSTVHGTFAAGNPGIDLGNLGVDEDSAVDHVFCSWTTANGGGSTNTKYPGYELTNGLPYPNSSELDIIVLGTTDADTDSGSGVTDWQRKVVELGLTTLAVTGVMSSAWVAVVREVQEQFDLLVDGQIGPQTWTAVLTRVDESVDLRPRRLPMAWKSETWPTKDSANGVILGPNPDFDPHGGPPNQIDLELGGPLTRADVLRMARTYLDVNGTAVVTGSIQYRGCLDDLARTSVDIGQNHKILGFEGRDVVVQVGRLSVDLDVGTSDSSGSAQYVVAVDVDERARDALTIDQILERNREALPDPARRPGNPDLLSRTVKDRGFSWDADSPCGILRRTAVNGNVGLWSRAFVPFSEVGRLSKIVLYSEMEFAVAVTASLRLTENMMLAEVGNPLAQDDPWRGDVFQWLVEEHGLLGAWGSQGDPCGYGWNMKSNGGAFQGMFVDGTTLEYVTEPETSPLVAVHLFGASSGSVWGRFYPAWDVS